MSIVIGLVTHNSLSDLPGCIATVRAQTQPEIRLMVFDNASSDGSPDWVERHAPEAMLHRSDQNLGYGRAHNQILKQAELNPGDYYLALNPDVRMRPEYVEALRGGLLEGKGGWGTGKLRLFDDGQASTPRLYSVGHGIRKDGYFFNIGYGLPDEGQYEKIREVFGAPGAAALYAQPLIESVSDQGAFFDEDFFMYGEDTDVDWRARNAGWKCIYVPTAVADHRGSHATERLKVEAVANRYLSVLKNARGRDLLLYNVPIILMHTVFRLLASPREGLRLAWRLVKLAPKMLARRSVTLKASDDLDRWFVWSRNQETAEPMSLLERLGSWRLRRGG